MVKTYELGTIIIPVFRWESWEVWSKLTQADRESKPRSTETGVEE